MLDLSACACPLPPCFCHASEMSDRGARFRTMSNRKRRCPECVALALAGGEFCPKHQEVWARTEGLVATLACPPRKMSDGSFVPVGVEIEIEGQFSQIETMALDSERIIITTKDGKRVDRDLLEGAPPWRRL